MDKTERDTKLTALKGAVDAYVDKETARLKAERTFLQSILDSSAGAAVARSKLADEVRAISSVKELVKVT